MQHLLKPEPCDLSSRTRRRLSVKASFVLALLGAVLAAAISSTRAEAQVVTGLTATPGGKEVMLTWSAYAGATGYNVYRGTTVGSYSEVNLAPLQANAYFDADGTLSNGTTYYYVVTALTAAGQTPDSADVSATPVAQNGTWTLTYTDPTNSATTPSSTTATALFGYSANGSIAASAFGAGVFSITSPITSTASTQGQWTATWNPGQSGAQPTLLALHHTTTALYAALVSNASGTAQITNGVGTTMATVTYPNSLTASRSTKINAPVWNTSDLTQVSETTVGASSEQDAVTSSGSTIGWQNSVLNTTDVLTVYTSAYFATHSLTIVVPETSLGITTSATGTSTSSTGDIGALSSNQDVVEVK